MSLGDKFAKFDESLHRLDGKLQRGLDNSFAFVMGGKLVASELEQQLRSEMEDNTVAAYEGYHAAPNVYTLRVSGKDFANLSEKHPQMPSTSAGMLTRFARSNKWQCEARVVVEIVEDPSLRTGQLNCSSRFDDNPSADVVSCFRTRDGEVLSAQPPVQQDYQPEPQQAYQPEPQQSYQPPQEPQQPQQAQQPPSYSAPSSQDSFAGWQQQASQQPANQWGSEPHIPPRSEAPASSPNYAEQPSYNPNSWQQSASFTPPSAPTPPPAAPAPSNYPSGNYPPSYAQPVDRPRVPTVTLLLQDGSSRTYLVMEGSNIIGRGSDADFRLPDTGVSRRHAEIIWDGQDAILVDLQSTNGTMVGDVKIDNWLLADGDVITIGHSYIEVRITGGN